MTKKIALLTSNELASLIPDDQALVSLAQSYDLAFVPVVWNLPQNWNEFKAVVIRSPWDYVTKKEHFIQVLKEINESKALLINPLSTLMWNLDKRYLLELQNLQLPVPKTVLLNSKTPAQGLNELGEKIVIKPVISAGGFQTYCLDHSELARFDWSKLALDQHLFMAQEYLPHIQTEGEFSLIFFNSDYSHALKKVPRLGEFRVQVEHGGSVLPWSPSEHELELASDIMQKIQIDHTYARLDLARHPNGRLMIMELELIEPQLFFSMTSGAEKKFIEAIKQRIT